MGFVSAVKSAYMNLFDFRGRASRSEFWWFILFSLIATFVAIAIALNFPSASFFDWYVLEMILWTHWIASVSLTVRRLHDRDVSGLYYLIVFFPIIGPLVQLWQMIPAGTDGYNQYGPARIETTAEAIENQMIRITALLKEQGTIDRFCDAYDQQDFVACQSVMEQAGVARRDINAFIGLMQVHGLRPHIILNERSP